MVLSPNIAIGTGKTIVGKVFKDITKMSVNIDKVLSEEFNIRGRDMVIQCTDSLQKYSLTFDTRKKFLLPNKKKFKIGNLKRASLRPVRSLQSISNCINVLGDGFEINLNSLEPGELYILDIEYFIDDERFIDSLVNKNVARESPINGGKEYWMAAQLKHLDILKQDFGYIELRDVNFSVDVSIYQDIKMKIPRVFTEKLETIVRLTQPIGRSETDRLYRRLLHQQRRKYTGKEFELLKELQDLFNSSHFRNFIEIKRDFHYSDCVRGTDFYEGLPFPTWPKSMKIISQTDLSFENPAAEGNLIYKKDDFINDLGKIFKI